MHRFLYFDMGNVLLDFDHELGCRQAAALCGVSVDRVREVVFDSGMEWRYERGDLSSAQFFELFRSAVPGAPEQESLLSALSDIFQAKPGIESLLHRLRRRGHSLGILSNTCEAHWSHVHPHRFPFLADCFGLQALSFNLRAMKPEPEIYERAVALCGVPVEQVFFVDDRPENVAAARDSGMDAVQFHDLPGLERDLLARRLLE